MKTAIETLEVKELYKFRSIPHDKNNELDLSKLHRVERIFSHNELYFPSPDELNDPFEHRPNLIVADISDSDYRREYKEIIRMSNPEATPEETEVWLENHTQEKAECMARESSKLIQEEYKKAARICSFCATAINPLVWSHYSGSHEGFCLVFDANNHIFGGAFKVYYQDEYPTVDFAELDANKIFRKSALTKFTDWSYEKEYRLVSTEPNKPDALPVSNKKLIFPAEMLKAVIFGCRISDDDRELIEGWLKNRDSKVEFRQAKLSDTEYNLEIEILGST